MNTKKRTIYTLILLVLAVIFLTFNAYAEEIHDQTEQVEQVEQVEQTEDEMPLDIFKTWIGDNLDKIFNALTLFGSLFVFFAFKCNLIPTVKNGLLNVARLAGNAADGANKGAETALSSAGAITSIEQQLTATAQQSASDKQIMLKILDSVSDEVATMFACINTTSENRAKFQTAYASAKAKIAAEIDNDKEDGD